MRTIWKFALAVDVTENAVTLPMIHTVVHVGTQNGEVCLWIAVASETDPVIKRFRIIGTGHPLPDHCRYVGTTQVGPFVWHVVELTD